MQYPLAITPQYVTYKMSHFIGIFKNDLIKYLNRVKTHVQQKHTYNIIRKIVEERKIDFIFIEKKCSMKTNFQ